MRRLITILLLVVILAGAAYAVYQWQNRQRESALDDLQIESASRGELVATIGATGTVRSQQTASLFWKTSGTVEAVNVNIGDQVQAGDVLATLAQTSLPQNVILAQADLVNAKKALDDLYTQAEDAKVAAMQSIANNAQAVKSAQFQLDNYTVPQDQADLGTMEALDLMEERLEEARKAFEPYKYLSSSNTTRQDLLEALNEAQSNYNSAVRRLDYEYELAVAEANLKKARQDYEKWKDGPDSMDVAAVEARIAAAEATISQAWIEAPFNGTITLAMPQAGDQISLSNQGTSGTEAFRLDNFSTLLVDVQVSEVDINQVEVGQDVTLSFDAILAEEYHGIVIDVARAGTTLEGVVDFTVTIKLTDVDEEVKPGMTAAVNIVVSQLKDVLLVPNRAVRIRDGQRVVYVLQNGEVVPVEITLGASSETNSEVIEGNLKVGDSILLNPPVELEHGQPPFAGGR